MTLHLGESPLGTALQVTDPSRGDEPGVMLGSPPHRSRKMHHKCRIDTLPLLRPPTTCTPALGRPEQEAPGNTRSRTTSPQDAGTTTRTRTLSGPGVGMEGDTTVPPSHTTPDTHSPHASTTAGSCPTSPTESSSSTTVPERFRTR